MVNHAQYPNCDWNIDDGVQITTNMPVPAGSEFFINYGPQFNDKLVQYYGFSLDRLDDVSYDSKAGMPGPDRTNYGPAVQSSLFLSYELESLF